MPRVEKVPSVPKRDSLTVTSFKAISPMFSTVMVKVTSPGRVSVVGSAVAVIETLVGAAERNGWPLIFTTTGELVTVFVSSPDG